MSPQKLIAALLMGLLLFTTPRPGQAERIVFQRGDALYVADGDGKNVRRLFAFRPAKPLAWSPSPDGRRLAWAAAVPSEGDARPVAVYTAELSGRNQRPLLRTDALRSRQGEKVTRLATASGGTASPAEGELRHLAWSADGKSLYLSFALPPAWEATFVVDAATGAAVVDASGRWKVLAPVTDVEARDARLVGIGRAGRRSVLMVTDLAEGRTTTLSPPAAAASPALSPDGKSIVFATDRGLWLADTAGKDFRRLSDRRGDRAPRWSGDGKRILFLAAPASSPSGAATLQEMPPSPGGKRRLLLPNVDRFFLIPD